MAKLTYYEKLKDPRWQKLRLEVMQKNDFCCELCGDGSTTLNVHHKEYFSGRNPWDYSADQLACLCEICHESEHDGVDLLKYAASYLKLDGPNNRTEIAFLICGYQKLDYQKLLEFSEQEDCIHLSSAYKAGFLAKDKYEEILKEGNKNGAR